MPSAAGRIVYRNPSRPRLGLAIAAVVVLLAWLDGWGVELRSWIVPTVVLAWASWHNRVIADVDGLHLHGVRHRRIPWDDIAGITCEPGRRHVWDAVLVVRTRDGRTFRSVAVAPVYAQTPDYAVAAARDLHLRWCRRPGVDPRAGEASAHPARPRQRAAALRRKRRRRSR